MLSMLSIAVTILLWLLSFSWPSIPRSTPKQADPVCCENVETTIHGVVPKLIADAISQALGVYVTTAVLSSQMGLISEQTRGLNESYRKLSGEVRSLAEIRAQNSPRHGSLPTSLQQIAEINSKTALLARKHDMISERLDQIEVSIDTYKSQSVEMSSIISTVHGLNESSEVLHGSFKDFRDRVILSNGTIFKHSANFRVETDRLSKEISALINSVVTLHRQIWLRDTIILGLTTGAVGYYLSNTQFAPIKGLDYTVYAKIVGVVVWGYWLSNIPYTDELYHGFQWMNDQINHGYSILGKFYDQISPIFTLRFWLS